MIGARLEAASAGALPAVDAQTDADAAAALPTGSPVVSWAAIVAGAFVAGGATLILGALGVGLGFATAAPGGVFQVSAVGVTTAAAIWLVVTQWVSSGLGGYIAGRLRGRWYGTHAHEAFFRDTAHGLITWAFATLLMGLAASSWVHVAADDRSRDDPAREGEFAREAESAAQPGYAVDQLFRPPLASVVAGPAAPLVAVAADQRRDEARRIVEHAVRLGSVTDTDRGYLGGLVAGATGTSPADAQRRVDELFASIFDAREAAAARVERVRRAAAGGSLLLSLSLLVGAFIACVTAAIGGRLRDQHP